MTSALAPGVPEPAAAEPEASDPRPRVALEEILPTPDRPPEPRAAAKPLVPGMRTARVTRAAGRKATIAFRGQAEGIEAAVAPEVDTAVVVDAIESGESVLVEIVEGEAPLVVGVLHTRRPRELKLKASTIQIEGDEEVLIRSGRGAVRIRADGDIEVVGSRISASSRGL